MKRSQILVLILVAAAGLKLLVGGSPPVLDPVPIARPLSEFPRGLVGASWKETDLPLDERTLEVSRVSDYLQRSYNRPREHFWFYVGYVDHWDTSAIHHPEVCFPSVGLDLSDRTILGVEVPGLGDRHDDPRVRFNELLWKDELGNPVYTLYTFYFNGRFEPRDTKMRAENTLGIPYFAVVTLSRPLSKTAIEAGKEQLQEAARLLLPSLVEHFPVTDGPGDAPGEPSPENPPAKSSGQSGSGI